MSAPSPRRRELALLLLCFAAASLLQHLNSFWVPHREGDEVVYLTLGREMGWDLSHYTTMDHPLAGLPSPAYRAPVFLHPPLLPLVLKLGDALGRPVATGLVFANLAMLLLFVFTGRAMALLEIPPRAAALAFAGAAFCPLLLFSTTRLHHDGLLGIFMACGLVAFLEALDSRSRAQALLAGLLLAIALNLRFNAISVLPLLVAIQGYHLFRLAGSSGDLRSAARDPGNWQAFAIVVILVATLGLQHYYRVAIGLGTLWPWTVMAPPGHSLVFNEFTRSLAQRTRWHALADLLAIFPFLALFLTPWPHRRLWRGLERRSWGPLFTLIFLYLTAIALALQYDQLRYFAVAMPFLYLGLPDLLRGVSGRMRAGLFGLLTLSLFFMVTTGYQVAAVKPRTAKITPSAVFYLPPLRALYP